MDELQPGQIGGIVTDPNGAVVPGASITVINTQTGASRTTTSDAEGLWTLSGMTPGPTRITVTQPGFTPAQHELELSANRPARLAMTLAVGSVSELVTVTSDIPTGGRDIHKIEEQARKSAQAQLNMPSQNVFNLQRRVAGILPVRVDVPRSGKSYRFVRPLVLQEETKITFQYRSR